MRTAHRVRLAASWRLARSHCTSSVTWSLSGTPRRARAEGHRYMADLLAPIAVLVLAAALATLLRGTEGASPARAPLVRRIAVFVGALLAIYVGQELLEGIMASGHSANLTALLVGGGWVALPLAVAIGTLAALLARLARGSRARDRGDPRRAAAPPAGARGRRQGPSGPASSAGLRAARVRPSSTAASAGTCLVRCPSARVVPSFGAATRVCAPRRSSRCNRGLHGSACSRR